MLSTVVPRKQMTEDRQQTTVFICDLSSVICDLKCPIWIYRLYPTGTLHVSTFHSGPWTGFIRTPATASGQ